MSLLLKEIRNRKFLILNVTPSPTRQLSPKHKILMIGRKECNYIINFNTVLGKNKLGGPEKFQFYTTLVALFEIRFRSLFFDVEKRRQCSEVTIP